MVNTILFDLDGTLLDTNDLIIQSFMHVLKVAKLPSLTKEQIIPQMGRTLVEQLQLFSGQQEVTELISVYRDFNIKYHDELIREFPYVKEAISELHRMGVKLAIVTTKMRKTSLMGLSICGIAPYFKTIITLEDVVHPKPHPEPVQKALQALGSDPSQAMMVGDSPFDIESANRAGVTSVGVEWSLKGREGLKPSHPKHMISDIRDLYEMVGLERKLL